MNFGNAFRIAAVVCLGAAKVITAVLGDRETQSLINSTPIAYNSTPCQPNFNFYDYNNDSRRGNVQYVQPIQVPVYQCYPTQQYVAPQPVQPQYAPVQAPVQQYVQPQQVQLPVPMAAPTSPQVYTVPNHPYQPYGYDNYTQPVQQPVQQLVNYYQSPTYQPQVQPATYPTYQNVQYAQPQYPINNYQYMEQQRQYEIQEQQRRQQLYAMWDEQARRGMAQQQAYQAWMDDPVPVTFLEKVKRRFNLPDGMWETMNDDQRMALLSNDPELQARYAPTAEYNRQQMCTQQACAYQVPHQQERPRWMNISFNNGVSQSALNDNPWWNQQTGSYGNTVATSISRRSPEYENYLRSL